MLEIKKISKSYKTDNFVQHALSNISLNFRKNEFVAILGPSGSGKTTLLNIIGGLDKYDSGDLIINNKSTKKFKDRNWDSYRNSCIGFIFQSYNLISHLTILDNVMMSMTLSNVNNKEKRQRALDALKKVGLENHYNKKPNQLSGGQMQRVAIARALVNDPDIILADEPTGALDSKTSIQIMDLIKELSKDRLVIMVTHNNELANEYANRIIKLSDGKIIEDSNPVVKQKDEKKFIIRKTAMKFRTALKLSFNNIRTKKGRTILTAFASSIGIIGIALILALSNGFHKQVTKFEKGILSAMPMIVSSQSMNMDSETMKQLTGDDLEKYPSFNYIISKKDQLNLLTRENNITKDYIEYIENMPSDYAYGYSYYRVTAINLLVKKDDSVVLANQNNLNIATLPENLDDNKENFITTYYDVLAGRLPKNEDEIVLIVDSNNGVNENLLVELGFEAGKNVDFDELLDTKLNLVLNDDYYVKYGNNFMMNTDYEDLYNNKSKELKISAIIRMKEDFPSYASTSGLAVTEDLMKYIIDNNKNSEIVKAQRKSDVNILTGMPFNEDVSVGTSMTKDNMLAYLGDDSIPMMIYVYSKDFESKDDLTAYLDKYNENLDDSEKIVYLDQANLISSMSGSIMSAITYVLVAFSSVSLIVSSIMIGVITYISVLERTKEIGILRALGARKKDISRVFNAETFIIGITSGLIGIGIARILIFPINSIIYNLTELENVAVMNPWHAIMLVIISTILTMIGGFIPAKMASKKDPVISLRSE